MTKDELKKKLEDLKNRTPLSQQLLLKSTVGEVGLVGNNSAILLDERDNIYLIGGKRAFIHINPETDGIAISGRGINIEGEVNITSLSVDYSPLNTIFLPPVLFFPALFNIGAIPFLTPIVTTDIGGSTPHVHTISMITPQPLFNRAPISGILNYINTLQNLVKGAA